MPSLPKQLHSFPAQRDVIYRIASTHQPTCKPHQDMVQKTKILFHIGKRKSTSTSDLPFLGDGPVGEIFWLFRKKKLLFHTFFAFLTPELYFRTFFASDVEYDFFSEP
jgi:hypothetical protein